MQRTSASPGSLLVLPAVRDVPQPHAQHPLWAEHPLVVGCGVVHNPEVLLPAALLPSAPFPPSQPRWFLALCHRVPRTHSGWEWWHRRRAWAGVTAGCFPAQQIHLLQKQRALPWAVWGGWVGCAMPS